MAQREQRPNEAVLFKNEDKKTDKHPDYKGWGEVGGVAVWLAAWVKQGKNGKFMSLAFTPKDEQRAPKRDERVPASGNVHDIPDDLPF